MNKTKALLQMSVKIPVTFLDQEDLEQQVDDLREELESLGFEPGTAKCKLLEDDSVDEEEDFDDEEQEL